LRSCSTKTIPKEASISVALQCTSSTQLRFMPLLVYMSGHQCQCVPIVLPRTCCTRACLPGMHHQKAVISVRTSLLPSMMPDSRVSR
jgi:hypothetical protein